MRRSKLCAAALLMAALLLSHAAAAEVGSLRILDVEEPVALYRVADEAGTLTEAFADAPVKELTGQRNAVENARILAEYARTHALTGTEAAPDGEGQVFYSALDRGLYLVLSLAAEEEFNAFLVSVPTHINDQEIYDIEAKPKEEQPEPSEPTGPSDPSEPTGPSEPSEPSAPSGPTEPEDPDKPDIPQTGVSVWPKYSLLAAGILLVAAGTAVLLSAREKRHE